MECAEKIDGGDGLVRLRVAGGACWVQSAPGRPSLAEWRAAVAAYAAGASLDAAIEGRSMSRTGMHLVLKRMGLTRSPKTAIRKTTVITAEHIERARQLLERGLNAAQVAAVMDVGAHALRYRLADAGLALGTAEGQVRSLRSRRTAQRRTQAQRRLFNGERSADVATALGVSRTSVLNYWHHPSNPFLR